MATVSDGDTRVPLVSGRRAGLPRQRRSHPTGWAVRMVQEGWEQNHSPGCCAPVGALVYTYRLIDSGKPTRSLPCLTIESLALPIAFT
jgi:hypothetical protein